MTSAGAAPDLTAAVSLSDGARERLMYAADTVLREHTPLGSDRSRKPRCRCGWRWSPGTDHTAHLAEVLAGATSTNEAYVEMLAEVFGRG